MKTDTPKQDQKAPASMRRLVRLSAARQKATEELCKGIVEEFPIGTVIEATLGRARIEAEVTGHADDWCDYYAGSMTALNVRTGKRRTIWPLHDSEDVVIISKPNVEWTGNRAGPT